MFFSFFPVVFNFKDSQFKFVLFTFKSFFSLFFLFLSRLFFNTKSFVNEMYSKVKLILQTWTFKGVIPRGRWLLSDECLFSTYTVTYGVCVPLHLWAPFTCLLRCNDNVKCTCDRMIYLIIYATHFYDFIFELIEMLELFFHK